MLRTSSLCGIPMVRRTNRRRLVVCTYAGLLMVTLVVLIVHPWPLVWMWFVLVSNGVSGFVFGRLVKQSTLPEGTGSPVMSLGLSRRRRDEDAPDERDIAVRNQAYFLAFRIMTLYSMFLFIAIPVLLISAPRVAPIVIWELTIPLLVIALTLPQAILLWTEPDMAIEG